LGLPRNAGGGYSNIPGKSPAVSQWGCLSLVSMTGSELLDGTKLNIFLGVISWIPRVKEHLWIVTSLSKVLYRVQRIEIGNYYCCPFILQGTSEDAAKVAEKLRCCVKMGLCRNFI
jgi:hypothetical protein